MKKEGHVRGKIKKCIKIIFGVLLSTFLMLQELEYAGIIVKAQFEVYENEVGEYVNQDLEQAAEITHEVEIKNEGSMVQGSFRNKIKKEEEVEEGEEIERVDEYTTIREGEEAGVYEVEISMVAMNYEEDGEYKEIETRIEIRDVNLQRVEAILNEEVEKEEAIEATEVNKEEEKAVSEEIKSEGTALYKYEEKELMIEEKEEELSYEERYPYFSTKNVYQVEFPYSLERDGVIIKKGEVRVVSQPMMEGELGPEVRGNEIVYLGTNEQSIRYRVENGELKEDYLVYSPYSGVFQSRVSVESGSIEDGDNRVIILDGNKNPVFYLTAPVAYDASGAVTYDLSINYADGIITIEVDQRWLEAEERVYPITVDPSWNGMAHYGVDTSIAYNQPDRTIGNPDMGALNWSLPVNQQYQAVLYYGEHPTYGNTVSFYKMVLDGNQYFEVLAGKYIRRAYYKTPFKYASKDTGIISCTLSSNYDTGAATYRSFSNVFNQDDCNASAAYTEVKQNTAEYWENIALDITDYVRGVFEFNQPNYGAVFLVDPSSGGYVESYGHEFYYMDTPPKKWTYPSITIEYADTAEVDAEYSIDETTIELRPFVVNSEEQLYTQFSRLGIDGVAKRGSTVSLEIKEGTTVVYTANTKSSTGGLFLYPKYQLGDSVQSYDDILESNYQFNTLFSEFETGKLYEVSVSTTNSGVTGRISSASFQLYEVKRFDLLSNISVFYGVSVEQIMQDNNLSVEIVKEGSRLFISNPKKNQGINYPSSQELSSTEQQIIYDYLRGMNEQNEYAFGPVNLNTGNLVLEEKDFSYYVGNKQFFFLRSYNSSGHNELGSLGWGWKQNHDYQLTAITEGIGIVLGDGTRLTFQEENGVYLAISNKDYKLTKIASGWILATLSDKYEFNESGRLTRHENHRNEITRYEYQKGLLYKVIYGENKELVFDYNDRHLISRVTKLDGNTIDFEYDEAGHLVRVYDENGNYLSYSYDENHYLIETYNKKQQLEAVYHYDSEGRVIEVEDGKGRSKEVQYYPNKTIEIDSKGHEKTVYFDEYRQTTRIEEADGSYTTRRYDMGWIKNNLENGVFYKYEYDYKGNLLYRERVVDGAKEKYAYDQFNNLIKKTDMMGLETVYEYDARNNLIREIVKNKTTGEELQWVDKEGNYYTLPQTGFSALPNENAFDDERWTNSVSLEDVNSISWQEAIRIKEISYGFSVHPPCVIEVPGTFYGELADGSYEVIYQGDLCEGSRIEISSEQEYYGLKLEHPAQQSIGTWYLRDLKITKWQEKELQTVVTGETDVVTEYEYRGGNAASYPSVEWWVRKTGNLAEISNNSGGVGYDASYGPYAVGSIRPKMVSFQGTIGNSDTYANGYTIYIDISTDGGVTWKTVGNKYVVIGGRSTQVIDYTVDLDGQDICTHIRYRTTGKHHSRNWTMAISEWLEENPNQGHSSNASYVGGEYVCNVGYVGNGAICDAVVPAEEANQLIRKTDPEGNVTSYEYDQNGNQNKISYPDGTYEYTVYNSSGEITGFRSREGYITSYTLNERGEVIVQTNPDGSTLQYEYDADGNLIRIQNELNQLISYSYDQFGNVIKQVDGNGNSTLYEYDDNDNQTKVTYPDGSMDLYQYDEKDRISYENKQGVNIEYSYNQYGVESALNHRNNLWRNGYDSEGRLVSIRDYLGMCESFTYNEADLMTSKTDKHGIVTNYIYDDLRNLIVEEIQGKIRIEYEYNKLNQLIKKKTINIGEAGYYLAEIENKLGYLDENIRNDVAAGILSMQGNSVVDTSQ